MEGKFGNLESDIQSAERGIDDVGSGVKFKGGFMSVDGNTEEERDLVWDLDADGDMEGEWNMDGDGDKEGNGLEEILIEDSLGNNSGGITFGADVGQSSGDSARYLTPMKTIQTTETVVASNQITVVTVVEPPRVGMVFKSWEDIESYYKDYAEQQGFGVSRVQAVNSKKDRTKRIATTWRCECWGRPDMRAVREAKKRAKEMEIAGPGAPVPPDVCEDDETLKGKRTSKKCLCTAKIYASLNGEGDWELKTVELEHSGHNPTPSKAKLVKEYRMKQMTSNVKRKLLKYFDQGVSVSQFHGCMGTDVNGIDNLALTVKDLHHEVYKAKRLNMVGGDAVAMLDYFEKMQSGNQNFYHSQRLDDHGRLKDVFWVDARSRAAYEDFGDVVCFDATYLTNEYELPFVNFIGANHHGQSLLLGCALVSHEDCDTYSWIFQQWLTCMNGRAPQAILTDQAAAMRRPLREIMPNTCHRWCIWHILGKIPEKLGKYARYNDFKNPLKAVVYESFTTEEFHSRWAELVAEYDLEDDPWLLSLHKESHMWVPAYMKEFFWAGMKTTQRVESINRFFDGFVNRNTKLHEFPRKYSMALAKRVRDEVSADSRCSKYVRRVVSGFKLEKFFQKIYTDKKFLEFQTECARMSYCFVRKETVISDNETEYVLEDRIWIVPPGSSKEIITDRRRNYTVKFFRETRDVTCDCRKFETHGILCKHCIRILDQNFIFDLPEKYVLDRWRKDIPRKHTRVKVPYYDPFDDVGGKRFNKMMSCFEPICDTAALVSDETVETVMNCLVKLKSEIEEASRKKRDERKPISFAGTDSKLSPGQAGTTSSVKMPDASQVTDLEGWPFQDLSDVPEPVKDPIIKKKRPGRPKETRHKTLAELGYKVPKAKARKALYVSPDEVETPLVGASGKNNGKRKGQAMNKPPANKKQKGNSQATTRAKKIVQDISKTRCGKNNSTKKSQAIPSSQKPNANSKKTKASLPRAKANTGKKDSSTTNRAVKSKAKSKAAASAGPGTQASYQEGPGVLKSGKGKQSVTHDKRKRKRNAKLDDSEWISDMSLTF